MIENRAFKMDDYLAMLQRRLKLILIPALLAPVVGFLVSYAFLPKYTASSLILVAGQKVPEGYAKPLATQDLVQLIAAMQEQVLSRAHMIPMIDRMGLAKDKSADDVIEDIRANLSIEPIVQDVAAENKAATDKADQSNVSRITVNFTTSDPKLAQRICAELTSMLLEQNPQARENTQIHADTQSRQQGVQMHLLKAASLPDAPSFPDRLLFVKGGLAGGLGIGLAWAFWLEFTDKSIRTEEDAIAVLDLPVMVSIPWLGVTKREGRGLHRHHHASSKRVVEENETVEV
jgi:uncharacterized protein involved in exopolysaccharide biosynthesis